MTPINGWHQRPRQPPILVCIRVWNLHQQVVSPSWFSLNHQNHYTFWGFHTSMPWCLQSPPCSHPHSMAMKLTPRWLSGFLGGQRFFDSYDSFEDDPHNNYPRDFLNSIIPNGLPPHDLKIKENCPLILLWNLDPQSSLCNERRLTVLCFDDHIRDVEIVHGTHAGDRVLIPKIPLLPSEDLSLPFKFKRKQFLFVWVLRWLLTKLRVRPFQLLVYISLSLCSHMVCYMLRCPGVYRVIQLGFWWSRTRTDRKGNSTKNIV